jgi:hypothetical protein
MEGLYIAADMREKNLDVDAVNSRSEWRRLIKNSDPI